MGRWSRLTAELKAAEVAHVVMESTGIYWRPVAAKAATANAYQAPPPSVTPHCPYWASICTPHSNLDIAIPIGYGIRRSSVSRKCPAQLGNGMNAPLVRQVNDADLIVVRCPGV